MTVAQVKKPPYPTDRLITGEELGEHPEWGYVELKRGKVVPVAPPKRPHGSIVARMSPVLSQYEKSHGGEVITGDSGVYTERNPDTVRGPDIYFVGAERVKEAQTDGYLEIPPDLCVEVISPTDRTRNLAEKVEECLAIGVKLIWVIDPVKKTAHVYRKGREPKVVDKNGALDGEDVLPQFTLGLNELFSTGGRTFS